MRNTAARRALSDNLAVLARRVKLKIFIAAISCAKPLRMNLGDNGH